MQLEQYELAKDTFLDGLQLDPASKALQAALRDLSAEFGEQLEQMEQTKRLKRSIVQRSDDLDCTICLKLLYNPITTPCGHSFCRACLLQTMDYGKGFTSFATGVSSLIASSELHMMALTVI
jgi:phosphoribosylformylglycinamidine (FGAM) synthase PurS component